MPRTTAKNLSDAPPATPGFLTTEFWKTLGFTVITVLIATGVITPVDAQKYQPVIDSVSLIAGAIALGFYSMSRSKTKAAAIEAAASVVMTEKGNETALRINRVPVSTTPSEQVGGEA